MTSALGLFSLFAFISLSSGGLYPKCWIKKGECLDSNVGPLIEAVAPQINHNIVKNASMGVESLDDCASQCFNETECRYVIMIEISVSSILIVLLLVRSHVFCCFQIFYLLRERNSRVSKGY